MILVLLMAFMMFMGITYFSHIRTAVGLQPYRSTRQVTLGPTASPEELDRLLTGPQARITSIAGFLGLLALLVLMIFKPF